jgi:hypothetical protein
MRLLTLIALAVALVVAGCGSDGGGDDDAKKPPSGSSAEQQITKVFDDYNAALLDRDYPKACGYLAPETIAKLRENVKKLDPRAPRDCPGDLELIYGKLHGKLLERFKNVSRTAHVDKVTVTGDSAIINWTATFLGKRVKTSQSARQVDGEWKLVDVSN